MWPNRVSNTRPLTYRSGALPTALRGPAYILFLLTILMMLSMACNENETFNEMGYTIAEAKGQSLVPAYPHPKGLDLLSGLPVLRAHTFASN